MGVDEWSSLCPVEMNNFIEAWWDKHEREANTRDALMQFIDISLSQNTYLTVAPNLKKGHGLKPADFRVIRTSQQTDPTEVDEDKKTWAKQKHLELALRAKARASEYFQNRKAAR